ncbi:class I SAM-dependent methyltransferase [Asanoa iriomotensis]|uniref:S-adenosyl-L-methionine-dependent methyltransferase n=1 Tax=Asanoa iriomotensis TaxID=234613 RepID=A0ABQ4C872_9ACTN|nr:SAM-dependent methyltransferase [Asanoa iriomotensis]GIF58981.1 S-adenosyl-L-methionine-dependent methyltransferase [Asanoa iriomotensis]
MQTTSRTALFAAAARAAHRIVDGAPRILDDHLAAPLLGDHADELIDYHRKHGDHPILAGARAQTVLRSAYTERALTAFVHRGPSQYLVLGAGLDSSPYRLDLGGTEIYEVDHPATSSAKQAALATAGVDPRGVTFVPVDLAAGEPIPTLDRTHPTFVSWLGVVMYLSPDEVARTVSSLADTLAPGSELVFDHLLPPALRDAEGNAYAQQVAAVAAADGEPWRSTFTPSEATDLLKTHGWEVRAQPDARAMVPEETWNRTDALHPLGLSTLAHARLS